ncbi:MAG TPA: hypothetical protein VNC40_09865 [Gaiellaceae bacterium]|nr:hypothetical protein [Gaiellaceae bacterium]
MIEACSNNTNGLLRIVANNQTDCRTGETAISWNVVGPQGPAGSQGPQGPAGSQGPQGAAGKDGVGVTSSQLPPGGSNCPSGGSSFTSASGTTYACDGASGKDGTNGTDGVSVTSQTLATGDTNCPNGGSAFTSASGMTYACNGTNGAPAPAGTGLFAYGIVSNSGSFSSAWNVAAVNFFASTDEYSIDLANHSPTQSDCVPTVTPIGNAPIVPVIRVTGDTGFLVQFFAPDGSTEQSEFSFILACN